MLNTQSEGSFSLTEPTQTESNSREDAEHTKMSRVTNAYRQNFPLTFRRPFGVHKTVIYMANLSSILKKENALRSGGMETDTSVLLSRWLCLFVVCILQLGIDVWLDEHRLVSSVLCRTIFFIPLLQDFCSLPPPLNTFF